MSRRKPAKDIVTLSTGGYTPEEKERITTYVLAQVSSGRAVSRIFREDAAHVGLCTASTFWLWLANDTDLSDKLARARSNQVECLMDETIEIADDGTNDFIEKKNADGEVTGMVLNAEHVQRSKLRIETRLKYAQMVKPKTYGAKVDLTSDGETLRPKDDVALSAAVLGLLEKAKRNSEGSR